MKFTGHERDPETGLDYMLARYYTSGSGRFLQVDPGYDYDPMDPMSYNLYSYVRGNPIVRTDPNGEFVNLAAAGVGAIIGGVISAGINVYKQVESGKDFNWKDFRAATAGGAVAGGVAGLTCGASLLATAGAAGIGTVAGGVVERGLDSSEETKAFDGKQMVEDGLVGTAGGALGVGASKLAKTGIAAEQAVQASDEAKAALDAVVDTLPTNAKSTNQIVKAMNRVAKATTKTTTAAAKVTPAAVKDVATSTPVASTYTELKKIENKQK